MNIFNFFKNLISAKTAKKRLQEEEQILQAEGIRKAEEQRYLEEEQRKDEELRHLEEELRKAEEQRYLEEERRKTEEQRHLKEEKRKAEEQRLLEEEQRKVEEKRRQTEEKRKEEDKNILIAYKKRIIKEVEILQFLSISQNDFKNNIYDDEMNKGVIYYKDFSVNDQRITYLAQIKVLEDFRKKIIFETDEYYNFYDFFNKSINENIRSQPQNNKDILNKNLKLVESLLKEINNKFEIFLQQNYNLDTFRYCYPVFKDTLIDNSHLYGVCNIYDEEENFQECYCYDCSNTFLSSSDFPLCPLCGSMDTYYCEGDLEILYGYEK